MKPYSRLVAALTVVALTATSARTPAHHSFAMFDRTKEVTIVGEVKTWQFTNPHAYLQVMAPYGEKQEVREWTLEANGPSILLRKGLRPGTFKAGDKVTVILYPLRNGAAGGELVSVTMSTGKKHQVF
ncbi:MAG: DUF6152 family protein [Steroidobacteraceae bacterium]